MNMETLLRTCRVVITLYFLLRIKIEEEYAKNLSKLSQIPLASQEEGWVAVKKKDTQPAPSQSTLSHMCAWINILKKKPHVNIWKALCQASHFEAALELCRL